MEDRNDELELNVLNARSESETTSSSLRSSLFLTSVGSDDGYATTEGHLHVDVGQGSGGVSGVRVVDVAELQKLLRRRADTLEAAGLGKDELQIGSGQLEVVLSDEH